jgi:hypothetical protein
VIAIAQNNLPPTFEIKSDTALVDTLPNKYWQMLEDKDGKLSFEQVQQFPFSNQFHYNPTGKINRKVSTNWFRFTIKNTTGHDVNIGFYDHYLGSSDWYLITDTIIQKKTGFETPWSKKDDLKLINFISTVIKAGEVLTVYERAYYDYFNFSVIAPARSFYVEYGFTNKVIKTNYILDESPYFLSIHDSFLFGLILFAAVFNFFFFLIVRERVYLYFAIWVFFLGFGRFNVGSEFFNVFLREHPRVLRLFNDFFLVDNSFSFGFVYSILAPDKKVLSLLGQNRSFIYPVIFRRIYDRVLGRLSYRRNRKIRHWIVDFLRLSHTFAFEFNCKFLCFSKTGTRFKTMAASCYSSIFRHLGYIR